MRRILLLLTAALVCAIAPAVAQVTDVRIKQINTVSEADLAAGNLTSPMVGDTVRIVGVASAATVANRAGNDFRPILTAGRRFVNYIQDTTGEWFGGIVVLAENDTIARETLFDRIDSGDVVRITGIVQQFPATPNGANQLVIARNSEVEILYHAKRPDPILVTIADFYKRSGASQTPQYTTGHRYSGMLVELRDVTVKSASASPTGRVTIVLVDDEGNEIRMRDQSGYFITRAAPARLEYYGNEAIEHLAFVDTTDFWQYGYGTFAPPTVGTRIASIVGTISANPSGGQTVPFMITPVYPDDLDIGLRADLRPSVTSVRRDIGFPSTSEAVTVTFNASPGDNPLNISSARVGFRVSPFENAPAGFVQYASASQVNDSTFAATLPTQGVGDIVQYWAEIADDKGNVSTNPRDTGVFKYFYRTYPTSPTTVPIRHLQYTPNLSGTSGATGFEASVIGVVVADTSHIPGDRGADPLVVIQSGRSEWSGIAIRAETQSGTIIPEVAALKLGDSVLVTGTVNEVFNVTMITDASRVDVLGTSAVPAPVILSTADIAQKQDGQTRDAEKWESMLIAYDDVIVTAALADATNFGEFFIADYSLRNDASSQTRVETDNSNSGFTTRTPGEGETKIEADMRFAQINGILYFSFGNYKLLPRSPEDMVISTSVRSSRDIEGVAISIVPNPANSAAALTIETARPMIATITLVDALGSRVATLVDNVSIAGAHRVALPLAELVTGTYFVHVTTPAGVTTRPVIVTR